VAKREKMKLQQEDENLSFRLLRVRDIDFVQEVKLIPDYYLVEAFTRYPIMSTM